MPPKKRGADKTASRTGKPETESVLPAWRETVQLPTAKERGELLSPLDDDDPPPAAVESVDSDSYDSVVSDSRATTPRYVPAAQRVGFDCGARVFMEGNSRAPSPAADPEAEAATKRHRTENSKRKGKKR
jgi:hypothetical protein